MMKRQKKINILKMIFILTITSVTIITLGIAPANASQLLYECKPDTEWAKCIKESNFETHTLKFWDANKMDWNVRTVSHAKRPPCSNEKFPVIYTQDSRVDNWIQIIDFHRPAPKDIHSTGFNISGNDQNWIMVDTSESSRIAGKPFIKDNLKDSTLYDLPCWSYRKNDKIEWEAFLFPVTISNQHITPLGGVRWGYRLDGTKSQVNPIPATSLSPDKWNHFLKKLKKTYTDWEFVEIKDSMPLPKY